MLHTSYSRPEYGGSIFSSTVEATFFSLILLACRSFSLRSLSSEQKDQVLFAEISFALKVDRQNSLSLPVDVIIVQERIIFNLNGVFVPNRDFMIDR